MGQLKNFLQGLCGDLYKLLPLKESEINGADNHIDEFIEAMIVNIEGAIKTYPALATQKQYLYVLNNMNYLLNNEVDFEKWRKIVLNSMRYINKLCDYCGGDADER